MATQLTTKPTTSSIVSRLRTRKEVIEKNDEQSAEIRLLKEKYPSVKNVIGEYSTEIYNELMDAGADYDFLAMQEDIPTLGMLSRAYGVENASVFLLVHIAHADSYVGAREKLSPQQMETLARAVLSEYSFLNVAEICFFFAQFILGKYGHLYGTVDPMRFTIGLNQYVLERNRAIERHELKRSTQQKVFDYDEMVKNSSTHDEYLDLLEKGSKGEKEALDALRLSQEECESLYKYKKNAKKAVFKHV